MTVSTAHVALGDLLHDDPRIEALFRENRNPCTLGRSGPVVEIENPDVSGTTVDARVTSKMIDEKLKVQRALRERALPDHLDMVIPIAPVVPA